jgi:hypothetical protein
MSALPVLKLFSERRALVTNRRAEVIVVAMAAAMFLLGISLVVIAYLRINHYFATGTLVAQILLYWPMREIIRLRRDNLVLQTVPAIVAALPPSQAAKELSMLLVYLRR